MRLAEFILKNIESILSEWESFARSLEPGRRMSKLALRNDSEHILRAAVRDMESPQTLAQQASKSRGRGGAGGMASDGLDNASALHGIARVGSGFDILEVVSEYRALRASVLRLWRASHPDPDQRDIDDITRFNEAIDQSLAQAVASYSKRIDQSRQMFLAILGHDLRNPLNCIRMAGQLVSNTSRDPECVDAVRMIQDQADVIARLTSDLIDFSSAGLGHGIPLTRGQTDLVDLCRGVFDGYRTTHSDRDLRFKHDPEVTGHWDAPRLRQVVSNLLGNALQHGSPTGPITLTLRADRQWAILSVHNEGDPIPPEAQSTIFEPLVRQSRSDSPGRRTAGSTGLGLYIVREIVHAHEGSIDLTSTADTGTTFTVRLPRG